MEKPKKPHMTSSMLTNGSEIEREALNFELVDYRRIVCIRATFGQNRR